MPKDFLSDGQLCVPSCLRSVAKNKEPRRVNHEPRTLITALAAFVVFMACGGSGDATGPSPTPASIVLSTTTASLVAGESLQLSAVVKSAGGDVITDETVTYSSDKLAIATVSSVGVVTAVGPVGSANITAHVGGIASAPALITVSAAAPHNIAKGTDLPSAPLVGSSNDVTVKITDSFGNAVAGVAVAFAPTAGGGSVSPTTAMTDASGLAGTSFTLGNGVGTNTVSASVAGLTGSPVMFSTVSVARSAASIVKIGTDPTSVVAGGSFSDSVRVQVTDAANNPKPGVSVSFAVTAGGGTVSPTTVSTDADGKAAAKFITGTKVGTNTASATVAGLTPIIFSSATIAGPAAHIGKIGADPASVIAGASFSDSIRVHVTDASNNTKSGVSVSFGVTAGGGTVSPTAVVTDADGNAAAKFITATTAGTNIASATVTGLTPVTFSTMGVAGPAARIVKVGADPASVGAGGSFSDSIRVQVTDNSNNPTSGVSVSFAVTAGGGTVTPTAVVTDVNGKAAAKFITGTTIGLNAATATVLNVGALTFSVTTVAPTLVWSSVPSGTTASLFGVWGISASSVWAVGNSGTILHFNGTAWKSVSSGTTQDLLAVWGTSASDVWAVGGGGTILHFNGVNWSSVASATNLYLYGVWGTSASNAWATGQSGTILHYNGTDWSSVSSGTAQGLYTVWGSSASDVWVAVTSVAGTLLHYNGTSWSTVLTGTPGGASAIGVWGSSASDVWAAGSSGNSEKILHYNGTTWSAVSPVFSSVSAQDFAAVWGSSSSDVWAVGDKGAIVHYDGTAWSRFSSGTTLILYGVWGSSASDAWAVGESGVILHGTPGP